MSDGSLDTHGVLQGCYRAIMMARIQVTLAPEVKRRARERAAQLGISMAEYVRRLIARDLSEPQQTVGPSVIFDLGDSGGMDVARHKDSMVGEAVDAARFSR